MKGVEISKIAVIGAGSWGTTLANVLAEKGFDVDLWVRYAPTFACLGGPSFAKEVCLNAELEH